MSHFNLRHDSWLRPTPEDEVFDVVFIGMLHRLDGCVSSQSECYVYIVPLSLLLVKQWFLLFFRSALFS